MREYEITDEPEATPPQFKLDGQEFTCRGEGSLSSLDVLRYVADMTGDNGLKRIQAVVGIFGEFIPDDDGKVPEDGVGHFEPSSKQRFDAIVKRKRVRLPLLFEIAGNVLDDYLAFPTKEAAPPASNGSSNEAPSSGGGSLEPVSGSSS